VAHLLGAWGEGGAEGQGEKGEMGRMGAGGPGEGGGDRGRPEEGRGQDVQAEGGSRMRRTKARREWWEDADIQGLGRAGMVV
jgi:hypothetical protein